MRPAAEVVDVIFCDQVRVENNGKLLLLGVLLGLLAHVPIIGLLAPAFGALAYVHYGLEALRRERKGANTVIEGEARRL